MYNLGCLALEHKPLITYHIDRVVHSLHFNQNKLFAEITTTFQLITIKIYCVLRCGWLWQRRALFHIVIQKPRILSSNDTISST